MIVAVFSLEDEALFAVEALESAGVDRARIGVLATRSAEFVRKPLGDKGFVIWIEPSGPQQAAVAALMLARHGATRVLESTR